ncbi:MAG: AAA family ATPase, partial [Gilliamella sp.]|nr:AAA family ATPase [Gilliamella sp.]
MIKLMSIEFPDNGIRKLKNLKINFADRITLIAGFNGIGKSTILGLVASSSGLTNKNINSYLNKSFSVDINEIIHFEPDELNSGQLKAPWPKLVYSVETPSGKIEHWKNISITKRTLRLRSVARTDKNSPDTKLTGPDAKIPLPTIYLGMLRMLPIGECSEENIISEDELIAPEDAKFLNDFINKVIKGTKLKSEDRLTTQSINNTKKSSKHPDYGHTSKSVSLGQDSLSSIATAIASFNKLKREQGDSYQGGILVIDEIDAGFHPHAQQNLIDALGNAAKNLSLQIVATTHSSKLIEYMHPDSTIRENTQRIKDKVIYLSDTTCPKLTDNWELEKIIADMSLSPLPKKEEK